MALTEILYGSQASSSVLNDNFQFLLNEIQSLATTVETNRSTLAQAISTSVANLESLAYSVGTPVLTLKSTLADGEIWLEGAVVSKTTYSSLFEVYGTTYNDGTEEEGYFRLPNFKDRAFWGADTFGYIAAGLPNIIGSIAGVARRATGETGAFSYTQTAVVGVPAGSNLPSGTVSFSATSSNSIYGNSTTVQPPAIKIRVKTRYR